MGPGAPVIPAASLTLGAVLGKGAFATVYAGKLGEEPVAVKVLPAEFCHPGDMYWRLHMQEAALLAATRHPNIIKCHGIALLAPEALPGLDARRSHPPQYLASILELSTAGTLHEHLAALRRPAPITSASKRSTAATRPKPVTLGQALQWMREVAAALDHLHTSEPPIIHRDIKLENVLLFPDPAAPSSPAAGKPKKQAQQPRLIAKLADFGLHQRISDDRPVYLRCRTETGSAAGPGLALTPEDSSLHTDTAGSGKATPPGSPASLSVRMLPSRSMHPPQPARSATHLAQPEAVFFTLDEPGTPRSMGSSGPVIRLRGVSFTGGTRRVVASSSSLAGRGLLTPEHRSHSPLRATGPPSVPPLSPTGSISLPVSGSRYRPSNLSLQSSRTKRVTIGLAPALSAPDHPGDGSAKASVEGGRGADSNGEEGAGGTQELPIGVDEPERHVSCRLPGTINALRGKLRAVRRCNSFDESRRLKLRFKPDHHDALQRSGPRQAAGPATAPHVPGLHSASHSLHQYPVDTPSLHVSHGTSTSVRFQLSSHFGGGGGTGSARGGGASVAGSLLAAALHATLGPGFERHVQAVFCMTGETGSLLYMAPEVFGRLPYAPSADIFSWAMLSWEVLTGSTLLHCCVDIGVDTPREFAGEVASGYRPSRPRCPDSVWALLTACWDPDPVARPTAKQVWEELTRVLKELGPDADTPTGLQEVPGTPSSYYAKSSLQAGRPAPRFECASCAIC